MAVILRYDDQRKEWTSDAFDQEHGLEVRLHVQHDTPAPDTGDSIFASTVINQSWSVEGVLDKDLKPIRPTVYKLLVRLHGRSYYFYVENMRLIKVTTYEGEVTGDLHFPDDHPFLKLISYTFTLERKSPVRAFLHDGKGGVTEL